MSAAAALQASQQANAALVKDAERWRFLMKYGGNLSFLVARADTVVTDCLAFLPDDRDGFLAAIDAAIAAQEDTP